MAAPALLPQARESLTLLRSSFARTFIDVGTVRAEALDEARVDVLEVARRELVALLFCA